jgi:hypothetical protein
MLGSIAFQIAGWIRLILRPEQLCWRISSKRPPPATTPPDGPLAIGFSNGAIIIATLLLAHPGLLAGAVLFRPLSPFSHDLPHRLDMTPVLIIDGEKDSRRSPGRWLTTG